MECILFRHGIAADRQEWDGPDAHRPLTAKGVHRTEEAAAGLRRLGIVPTHILASPFVRAFETAKILREATGTKTDAQVCEDLIPTAPPEKLLHVLSALPSSACVVCVGHEPHLGASAGVLLFGEPVAGLSLKKAGACCITFEGTPRAGEGVLSWWLMPSQLRRLGKD